MPRPRKPARLYYRKDERQWVIRDGNAQHRTGFGIGERGEAETALQEYLASRKPAERRGPAHPGELAVGEVLARYADDVGETVSSPDTLAYSIKALAPFWGNLTCDAVKGTTCRAYGKDRSTPRDIAYSSKHGKEWTRTVSAKPSTVRRELGVLQAALNYAHGEGLLIHPISVTLPEAGEISERWLTRQEAAKLLYHAAPHVRRFILLSLYTGRRMAAVLDLTWTRVDLDAGLIRFKGADEVETNKRRGNARIPRQLRTHLTRWAKKKDTHVVMYKGKPLDGIKTGIKRAAERAGVEAVSPHVLKHTAITWGVMNGMHLEDAAEYFDTSVETIRKHYWHHSPYHQLRAVEIIEKRR